jgi:hypothetical protein
MDINLDIFCSRKTGIRVVGDKVVCAQGKMPLTPESIANNWVVQGVNKSVITYAGVPESDLELWGAVPKDAYKFSGNSCAAETNREEFARRMGVSLIDNELSNSAELIADPDSWFYVKVWTNASKTAVTNTFREFASIMEYLRDFTCLNEELESDKRYEREINLVIEKAREIGLRTDVPLPGDWADNVRMALMDTSEGIDADNSTISGDDTFEAMKELKILDPKVLYELSDTSEYTDEEAEEVESFIDEIRNAENQMSTLRAQHPSIFDKNQQTIINAIQSMKRDLGRLAYKEKVPEVEVPGQMELMSDQELKSLRKKMLRQKKQKMKDLMLSFLQESRLEPEERLFEDDLAFASSGRVIRI